MAKSEDVPGRSRTVFLFPPSILLDRRLKCWQHLSCVPDLATLGVPVTVMIQAGSQLTLKFQPGSPGPTSARCVASDPPQHSESGFLGKLTFGRPGSALPVAVSKTPIGQTVMALDYTVTDADLAVAGDWTCNITNETDSSVTFQVVITHVTTFPVQTATIDIGLLNLLLGNAAKAASLTLQLDSFGGGGKPFSRISWSPAMAALVGQPDHPFAVADQSGPCGVKVRIQNLNSLPASLSLLAGQLVLELRLDFPQTQDTLVGLGVAEPAITLDFFNIAIQLDFLGNITPICNARAFVISIGDDISDRVINGTIDAINSFVSGNASLSSAALSAQISNAFALLMRFGPTQQIKDFSLDGDTLVVKYVDTSGGGTPSAIPAPVAPGPAAGA